MRIGRWWVVAAAMAWSMAGSGTASAGSFSYDDPRCSDFSIQQSGNNYTLACTFISTPGCQLRAFPASPLAGSTVTLVASCTGSPFGWIFTKGISAGSQTAICGTTASTCQDSVPSAGPIIYTVLGGNGNGRGPVTSITVNWR